MLELRSYRPEDAAAVWALHDAALDEAGVHGGRGPWEDDLLDIPAAYLEPGGEFLVAFAGGELVGMGGLVRHSTGRGEIKRMRVHPAHQRRGLGRRILAELEARAAALGVATLCLDTTEGQLAARRLYESAGYREVGRRRTERFVFVDFEKGLGRPAAPVLILSGPPGVGKSTVAEALAGRAGRGVHLESDAFFRFIRGGYVEPWKSESHAQNETVMRIVAESAAAYADAGYETVVEGIVLPGWFLGPLRDALGSAGHPAAYAVLRAPLVTCQERARQRAREPLADPAVVERLWRGFADLGELEPYAIEVSEADADAVADTVATRLADGSLAI